MFRTWFAFDTLLWWCCELCLHLQPFSVMLRTMFAFATLFGNVANPACICYFFAFAVSCVFFVCLFFVLVLVVSFCCVAFLMRKRSQHDTKIGLKSNQKHQHLGKNDAKMHPNVDPSAKVNPGWPKGHQNPPKIDQLAPNWRRNGRFWSPFGRPLGPAGLQNLIFLLKIEEKCGKMRSRSRYGKNI